MDRSEICYFFNRLLVKLDTLSSLLERAMESEGLTKVDDYDIEEIFNILYGPIDGATTDIENMLYENSARFREEVYNSYEEEY